jgi:SNF2 family DNA or RNA helicase
MRMLEIEQGIKISVMIGVVSHEFQPRGGCIADTVGMGKTAQIIALTLTSPDTHGCRPTLVLTPEHLCHQWRSEIAKFAPSLNVRLVTDESQANSFLVAYRRLELTASHNNVVIASLEYLNSSEYREKRCLHKALWHRTILDEVRCGSIFHQLILFTPFDTVRS